MADFDVQIQTILPSPVAVALAESLLREAGIPYFPAEEDFDGGNVSGFWNVCVPREREAEAREILRSVAEAGK